MKKNETTKKVAPLLPPNQIWVAENGHRFFVSHGLLWRRFRTTQQRSYYTNPNAQCVGVYCGEMYFLKTYQDMSPAARRRGNKIPYPKFFIHEKMNSVEIHNHLYLHLVVATEFCPKESLFMQVDHIDADRAHAEASNLEWVTPAENYRRRDARVRQPGNGSKINL